MPKTPLQHFKAVLHKHYIVSDDSYVDAVFGCCFANRIDADPTWMFLVGPPSSGKTVVLDAMTGHPSIYPMSKMTKNSLVSGWKDPRKKGAAPRAEFSMLRDLDGKILTLKDFTTMLSMRKDDLHEIIGELREAYDGHITRKFGNDKTVTIAADFGLIAAVTNAIDQYRGVLADLGERFLTYRMPDISDDEQDRRNMHAAECRNKKARNEEMRAAAYAVLDLQPAPARLCVSHRRLLSRVATFAARARANVRRHSYTKEAEYAHPEYPQRLMVQLSNFAAGIAMLHNRPQTSDIDINMARRMAVESVTYKRLQLMRHLLRLRSASVTDLLDVYPFSRTQVEHDIEDLHILGLLNIRHRLSAKKHIEKTYSMKNDAMLRWVLFRED